MQTQYTIQIVHCNSTACCEHWRSNYVHVFPFRFLPPLVPFEKSSEALSIAGNDRQANAFYGRSERSLKPYGTGEVFIDGGVFANYPELTALWEIRMQGKKLVNYHLLSMGTGCYNAKVSVDNWNGGYKYRLYDTNGLLVNMFMDSTRSLTETVMNNLAKFDNITRMKFNYKLKESMELDALDFAEKFKEDWEKLKGGPDFKALVYFYKTYIK
ncbi:unnamed protein product [Rotaria sp. Silwood2]|nr:unnamed protein product [Rotaria sp. Silwood2]CAF3256997.1 unnamed protein product [Rotaria sp. Silwood2]CAF4154304.1 unnamed protein product [Rotaria sp. Silwood2]CAF4174235.1 unnamed protein product [Rotaria sp. Silwood2]